MSKGTGTGLSSSLEDYLEIIHRLESSEGSAKSKAIADSLGISQASVTAALKALAAKDLIHYKPYSQVRLTEQGRTIAESVVRRHEILHVFFRRVLRLPAPVAAANACRVEHEVDPVVIDRLAELVAFLETVEYSAEALDATYEAYTRGLDKDVGSGRNDAATTSSGS